MKRGFGIGEVAKMTGLSVHTLRYYEKEGLLCFVRKNSAGFRVYTEDDLGWIGMIECLKSTGMTLKGIKQYIDWFKEGDGTLDKRFEMFKRQRKSLEKAQEKLRENMEKIDYKIRLYEEALRLGSLEKAGKSEAFKKDRLRLFGH